ncbi:polysaccharide biosynthesis tyrosine autokinase [Bradyrhizobium sp.]|uniref:polysaccharide biosynthesis tyrosine autokinase n=1 Tax=Bradyrhizobium sp. TaxID=376 RepID=UPI003C7184A6
MNVDESYQSNNQVVAYPAHDAPGPQLVSGGINLGFILDFARRRIWVILFSMLLMCGIGFTYFMVVPAPYTGVAVLKIDTRKFQLFQQPLSLGDQTIDEVESHLEALKSENLALKVITELHLADDAEFGRAAAIPIISNLIENRRPESETWRLRNALRIFEKHYAVERQGVSLIGISFESANAERSAQIANAIAQAYITEQLDAKYEVTRKGTKWLEGRIKELRDQVSAAQRAVIDYKAEYKMVDAGNGRLVTEQRLTDLNNQLTVARAKTSEMRARLDRISAALNDPADTGLINATASEVGNQLIMKLRTQYLDLAAREAEWSEKYGRDHLAVVGVRTNMRGIRASLRDELLRLRETYKSDYEVASEAEKLIEKQLQEAVAESQTSNEAQVSLGDLETSAETYKTLYDDFVKRYREATEQQSFPYTEARLITKAVPPIRSTYRKNLLIVAMTPFMGLVLGIGLGALLDFFDRGFRTSSQIEATLGLACIALVPLQGKQGKKTASQRAPSITGPSPDLISNKLGIASSVVEQPFSGFAEAIRTIKLVADLNGIVAANKVVGITSAIPDEGKSTIAAALALSIAQVGGRAILVDCDFRNPSLSRAITPNANAGILEVLSGKVALDEALSKEAYQRMAFLPVYSKVRIADSSELLSSSAMKRLFERLRHSYDYVIVDLPPLAPLADVRATTHLVDSYLLVVEWGATSAAIVQHALSRAPHVHERVVGAILNKVDMNALRLYDGNRAGYYRNKAYGRYGYTD